MLGSEPEDTTFDTDILIHINTALMDLTQIGVGPKVGFIAASTSTWSKFLGYAAGIDPADPRWSDVTLIEAVKTYVYLRVKLAFDPPENSALIASIEKQIERLEWRLNVQVESKGKEG